MHKTGEPATQRREAICLCVVLFCALLFYALFVHRTAFVIGGETYFTLVDDAMISMRYARNLANGFGLVWNAGEPPIQGFTNLAWTLYMALLHKVPIAESKISLLVMATSAVLLLATALLAFRLTKALAPRSRLAPLIAATITAYYYPLVFWSLRGMETGAGVLLLYLSVLLAIGHPAPISMRRALAIGVLLLLALCVRLDLALQGALVLAYVLYTQIISRRNDCRIIAPAALCYLGAIAGILLFQRLYFGSALPNSYYLKVAGVSVAERVSVGIQVFVKYAIGDFVPLLFLIVPGLLVCRELRNKETALLLLMFAVQCAYSIYVGGDYAEPLKILQVGAANRFITQGMPSVIILFGIVVDRLLQALVDRVSPERSGDPRPRPLWGAAIGLAALVVISGAPWSRWAEKNAPLLDADIWRAKLGVHIRAYTTADAVIAAHAAGQIPYYSRRRTIDLLGRSDYTVARGAPATSFRPGHNKWNYEYSIMTLKPDLVADEWGELATFLADKPDYYRLGNGIWVRWGSSHVRVAGLAQPYR